VTLYQLVAVKSLNSFISLNSLEIIIESLYGSFRDASQESGQAIADTCVWPMWSVYSKKNTEECGWNYMIS